MKRDNDAFTSPLLKQRAKELGEAIALARIARDMTQQDCADRAHISRRTLVRIESGDVGVSFSAWLQALGQVGLIDLLQPLSRPENDLLGESRRKQEIRRRVRKTEGEYEF